MLGNPGHRHPVYRRLARRARRGVTWLGRITVPAAGPGVFCVDRPSVSARRPSGTDGARRSVRSPGAGPGAGNGALVQRVLAEVPELLADAVPAGAGPQLIVTTRRQPAAWLLLAQQPASGLDELACPGRSP